MSVIYSCLRDSLFRVAARCVFYCRRFGTVYRHRLQGSWILTLEDGTGILSLNVGNQHMLRINPKERIFQAYRGESLKSRFQLLVEAAASHTRGLPGKYPAILNISRTGRVAVM